MGLTPAKLILKNPRRPDLQPVEVEALADWGAVHLCVPAHVQVQLALEEGMKKEVTLADGGNQLVPYVGPVELHFKNRVGYTGALVMGNEVLLGDTPYDIEAAKRAGVAVVAVRCGGWGDADLAGAVAIYDDPRDLLARYEDSPFGRST